MEIGGGQRVALTVANALVERGFSVDMALFRATGAFLTQLDPGVNVVPLNLDLKARPWQQMNPRSPLRVYLKECNPALTLSFGYRMNRAFLAAKIGSGYRGISMISEHTRFSEEYSNPVVRMLHRLQTRMLYRHADCCVCVSNGVRDDLIDNGILTPEQARVIYNPIFVADVDAPAPHPWFHDERGPIILGAGSFLTLKDFETLLRAFSILHRTRPTARLVLLGEGSHRKNLEKIVGDLNLRECVSLPGFFPNPAPYMAKASVFVLSSRREGFGNVLVEAMACGVNVVSTNCPSGPAEILDNGLYGWLTPVGDPDKMAAAMDDALRNPKPAEFLKTRAGYFSKEKSIENYVKLIEEMQLRKCS
jgi:glycosyltransferase involved in cell wall biosynthesis